MKTAAVLPSRGIGDALLMMIASHRLLQEGYKVVTFHGALLELQEWFPQHEFSQEILPGDGFDLIVAQNDNTPRMKTLRFRFGKKLSIFYNDHSPKKHLPLSELDQVFTKQPMADNIASAIAKLLKSQQISKNNGLVVPSHLTFQTHKKRIFLHPTSSDPSRVWSKESFVCLAKKLKQRGFEPFFAVSPKERPDWLKYEKEGIAVPHFTSLSELAKAIYESGYLIGNDSLLGHLASNMRIPTLIITNDAKRMVYWRPAWLLGHVITPPKWIPNLKFLRLREKYWRKWISINRILRKVSS